MVYGYGFKRGVENSFRLDFVFNLFGVSRNMAVVSFREANNEVAISKNLIVNNFTILIFKHEFSLSRPIFRGVINQNSLLVEHCADCALRSVPVVSFGSNPLQIMRLASNSY